ncbi:MAG: hypothetical protein ACRDNH_01470 [Gaiellaceae bacterium]
MRGRLDDFTAFSPNVDAQGAINNAAIADPPLPGFCEESSASGADGSPGTLDPGDTWTYRSSRKTAAAGVDCRPAVVPNSATAPA